MPRTYDIMAELCESADAGIIGTASTLYNGKIGLDKG